MLSAFTSDVFGRSPTCFGIFDARRALRSGSAPSPRRDAGERGKGNERESIQNGDIVRESSFDRNSPRTTARSSYTTATTLPSNTHPCRPGKTAPPRDPRGPQGTPTANRASFYFVAAAADIVGRPKDYSRCGFKSRTSERKFTVSRIAGGGWPGQRNEWNSFVSRFEQKKPDPRACERVSPTPLMYGKSKPRTAGRPSRPAS